jgi:hypothetical protein
MYIASKDNCIHTLLPGLENGFTHMTDPSPEDDGSVNGVIIWTEDPGNLGLYQLRRADFSVNAAGALTGPTIDPDPLDLDDPGVPDGDFLGYGVDIWGNGNHDELYLVMTRGHGDTNGGGSTSLWVYNLNNLLDQHEL